MVMDIIVRQTKKAAAALQQREEYEFPPFLSLSHTPPSPPPTRILYRCPFEPRLSERRRTPTARVEPRTRPLACVRVPSRRPPARACILARRGGRASFTPLKSFLAPISASPKEAAVSLSLSVCPFCLFARTGRCPDPLPLFFSALSTNLTPPPNLTAARDAWRPAPFRITRRAPLLQHQHQHPNEKETTQERGSNSALRIHTVPLSPRLVACLCASFSFRPSLPQHLSGGGGGGSSGSGNALLTPPVAPLSPSHFNPQPPPAASYGFKRASYFRANFVLYTPLLFVGLGEWGRQRLWAEGGSREGWRRRARSQVSAAPSRRRPRIARRAAPLAPVPLSQAITSMRSCFYRVLYSVLSQISRPAAWDPNGNWVARWSIPPTAPGERASDCA